MIILAWAARGEAGLAPFFVAGGRSVLEAVSRHLGGAVPVIPIDDPREAAAAFPHGLPVLAGAEGDWHPGDWHPGEPDRAGAMLALASLEKACALVTGGRASALVTGPISKARLAEVGFDHPGQTEFVAAACGIDPTLAVMMLAGPSVRTVPLTVHVALAEVPRLITRELIERRGAIAAQALREDFGIPAPRLAVAALNPHAGEEGRMGDEDARIVVPAIAALRAAGIDATGPHPADALFAPHGRAGFDAALCMYHDQALIPVKALDFDEGVNVTLGLPVVRTSPDHGTAFGIAGKGQARPGAMIAAIRMAGECADRRRGA